MSESKSLRFNIYKSKLTVDQFIAAIDPLPIEKIPDDRQKQGFKRIHMLDHFTKVKNIPSKIERMNVRGPLVIGIGKPGIEIENEREFKIEFFYDYEEDKIVQVSYGILDKKEMSQLSPHVIFQPSLGKGNVKWYLIVFGITKMLIFKRYYNKETKDVSLHYRFSVPYPEYSLDLLDDDEPIKIVGMQTLIIRNYKNLKYYKIQSE